MEAFIVLLSVYLILVLLVFPIWAFVKVRQLDERNAQLERQVGYLSSTVERLLAKPAAPPAKPAEIVPPPVVTAPVTPATPPPPVVSTRTSLPAAEPPKLTPVAAVRPVAPPPAAEPPLPRKPAINWEQFMGAKLFAWLGGLALLLGVAYFVKYSFDHDWIPPEVRVAIGFLIGAGLIVGGLRLTRQGYTTPAQTLVATGVVSLYAVTFACNSVYHFAFFGPVATFLLMALITAAAFFLAVRLEAQVVAVLGLLGGFLTPVLLSTGVDNPGGLFGYLALLDAGLVAVVLATGWRYLVPLSAGGTVLMMIGWADKFFIAEKGPVAMTVCLGFSVLYQAAAELARRREQSAPEFSWTAAALPFVGFGFAFLFLDYPGLAVRAPLYLGFVLLLDGLLLAQTWRDDALPKLHLAAGMVAFVLLAFWTNLHLTDELLLWALVGYLAFAALHTAFSHLLAQHRPDAGPSWWSQVFPPLTLVLLLIPIFKLATVSFLVWPAILLIDLMAVGLALLSASLWCVAAVLVLTLLATGLCIFRVPAAVVFAPSLLFVIGGFALFFFGAGFWLVRRLGDRLAPTAGDEKFGQVFGDARAQIPAFSSLLPFLLLVMVCARLTVPDPSMVFGLALLLAGLTLGLTLLLSIEWLPACALAGVAALEYAWHARHFDPSQPLLPLVWYLAFYGVFTAYPFAFHRSLTRLAGPWAVAALAGIVQFPLVYRLAKQSYPNDFMGLLPALFALPPLLSLVARLRQTGDDHPKRLSQLAWFGGAGLFFITLIFPVQFDRQWITLGWALEGAALLWLFHRVPHPGLRATGAVLLVVAFARLATNGAVFSYHPRSDTAIFNWYLYSYGIVTAALFAGARLLAPPRERVLGISAPPLLNALGVVLAFLLLNIEIADFFTPAGAHSLTFKFSGNFARDMTYTIAWALFAFGLLVVGIWRRQRAARYAAIGLLSVALLKLFLHDLARLEALYRIGALFAVAVVAILASFAYQRFLPGNEKTPPPAA
ncbi:MAG: DUF2339 domain-containing protein [Opitutae bacterium]|nr:DUF2339 domain-containing protein [Opitutae bacterium]